MRVVYCKNSSTNRDRHELQATLQVVPQGNRSWSWCSYTFRLVSVLMFLQ